MCIQFDVEIYNCWTHKYENKKTNYLTRFNKIAIQGTPQMAVDKEAIIKLI